MDLTLTTRDVDGKTIVAVGGEIDVYTAPKLRDKITELVAAGVYDIVIDMEGVEFLDSTGLRLVLRWRALLAREERSLAIVCPPGPVRKLFEVAGIADLLFLYESRQAAAAALVPARGRPTTTNGG